MKRFSKIQLILRLAAVVLALVAGFMVLTPQIYYETGDSKEVLKNALLGKTTSALIGDVVEKGAVGSFIGYLLLFVGAIALVVLTFIEVKGAKCITYTCAGLLDIGAILVLCVIPMYCAANDADISDYLKIGAGPVFSGIFGIFGGASAIASTIVK